MFYLFSIFLCITKFSILVCDDSWDWANLPVKGDAINCMHKPNDIFSCKGPNEIIECSSNFNESSIKIYNKILAIGKCQDKQIITKQELSIKLCIFPINSTNVTLNNNITNSEEFKESNLFIYFSEDENKKYNGIRINDINCYNNLTKFFQDSLNENENEVNIIDDNDFFYAQLINMGLLLEKKRSNHAAQAAISALKQKLQRSHQSNIIKRHGHTMDNPNTN